MEPVFDGVQGPAVPALGSVRKVGCVLSSIERAGLDFANEPLVAWVHLLKQ